MVEYYDNWGAFPAQNSDAGLADAGSILGKFVTSVDVGNTRGTITVTYGNEANSKLTTGGQNTLVFSAIPHLGSVEWGCRGSTIAVQYRPPICR